MTMTFSLLFSVFMTLTMMLLPFLPFLLPLFVPVLPVLPVLSLLLLPLSGFEFFLRSLPGSVQIVIIVFVGVVTAVILLPVSMFERLFRHAHSTWPGRGVQIRQVPVR